MPVMSLLSHLIPRFATRCTNYFRALWRRYRTPKQLRDADFVTWQANMAKCSGCVFLNPEDSIRPTCDLCGCVVELKTRWMSEKCDLGEWDNTIALRQRIAELGTIPPQTGNPKEIAHVEDQPAH